MTSTTERENRYRGASRTTVENTGNTAFRFHAEGFVTEEWEAAEEWEVPAGWPPAGGVSADGPGPYFATGVQPLPDWLAELVVPPEPAPPRPSSAPLPRRRDIRRGTAEIPVVRDRAPQERTGGTRVGRHHNPAAPQTGPIAREPLTRDRIGHERHARREDTHATTEVVPPVPPAPLQYVAPAGDVPAIAPRQPLPRRRDVHRPDRSAARKASVLAFTGGESPAKTTIKASRLPVTAARIGVVSVLVAVGAGVVGGKQLGLVGDGASELTADEGAAALTLAPLPTDPTQLSIWDVNRDQTGLEKGVAKLTKQLAAEAAERRRKRIEAEKKRKAEEAARIKAERAREAAMRDAQRNPQAIAKIMVLERGWSMTQFQCLDALWTRESNWNYQAQNPSSGAYGIPQALPGSKMASVASDWMTNPVTQITWGLNYIADRYGTPCGAWEHSESVGWY